ncbi:MAG TPA: leucine--tRNA ligase [Bacteroidia bacterium]|nr:leucine--tRNA ligase [Bacteroidia bacterium]
MMEYNFKDIENRWQQFWKINETYKVSIDASRPKYYVLDMFPYPSGAGLHVGHPLGYIASDIYSRYKKLKGFNVLHPMGYDSFGLPAEQYAIQTGQHPAITTTNNINRYREQLDQLGFSFDWSREVRTSDPSYYKWTQWIFLQLFGSWYNKKSDKAENIDSLIKLFEKEGNLTVEAVCSETKTFTSDEWLQFDEKEQQSVLLNYRLAFLSETMVNWCPALGTVLANEEVKDGVSERGGFPVERKLMNQWSLRISAYAERLLNGLNTIDWSDSIKEAQRNWIGKSEGALVKFKLAVNSNRDEKGLNSENSFIEVFTTRPDTIFGVTFVTLAPEHELVKFITTPEYTKQVDDYVTFAKNRSERERMADVKKITGQFTGAYVIHPFTKENIPVWIGDYVLAGYGTGAVMAVPGHDSRDYAFAKHFGLEIKEVVKGGDISKEAFESKSGIAVNSEFLNGLETEKAISLAIEKIASEGHGEKRINFRLRDAVFGRQRYWGEPIPVFYKNGIPYPLDETDLPLVLPDVDKFLPTENGEPPLARAKNWKYKGEYEYELTTMPGWAGSSWYFLRYMDSLNATSFASKESLNYWQDIDLYLGGSEHATGHLLYVRFWTKVLFDLGYIPVEEPAKKLINQGMIQGTSCFVYRINGTNKFVSFNLKNNYETTALHVDVNIVHNNVLDLNAFKKWREEFSTAEFITEEGKYICGNEVEKMSKSKWNVVSPDLIIEQYGADCLRMYEMFLGPIEQSKPWNTNGITGVYNFLRKFWRLFFLNGAFEISNEKASKAELKILHKTIKKVTDDIERFSFNTSVSTFMICVNELGELKCNKREILEPLIILISPFAPHIAEELWNLSGYTKSITTSEFPVWDEKFLVEDEFEYPVSVNGKTRFKITISLSLTKEQIEQQVLQSDDMAKYLNGNSPKKIIVVPGRIVNVVM